MRIWEVTPASLAYYHLTSKFPTFHNFIVAPMLFHNYQPSYSFVCHTGCQRYIYYVKTLSRNFLEHLLTSQVRTLTNDIDFRLIVSSNQGAICILFNNYVETMNKAKIP